MYPSKKERLLMTIKIGLPEDYDFEAGRAELKKIWDDIDSETATKYDRIKVWQKSDEIRSVPVARKVIGHVDVDSGTIMIIDPCYVLPDKRSHHDHQPTFPSPIGDETSVYLNATSTCFQPPFEGGGGHGDWHNGFLTSTLWGDGSYPVIAELNLTGQVIRLTIDFDPSEEHYD